MPRVESVESWDRTRALEAAEVVGNLGGWEWVPGRDEQLWLSDNLYRIFGLEPGRSTPTLNLILEQTHPDDRQRVRACIEMARQLVRPPPIEYRITQSGRGVRHLRTTVTTIEPDGQGASRIVGAVQDVTDQFLANREIMVHVAVSRVLAEWGSFAESSQRLLYEIAEAMEFVFAAMWLPQGELLTARLVQSDPSLDLGAFEAATFALRMPRGVEFLGRAWERGEPINITDVLSDRDYRRRKPAAAAGLHGAVAFPALYRGEALAVLEFYSRDEVRTNTLSETMNAIGSELGECLSRRRGQLRTSPLTCRELQVLQLAANGCSRSQIAECLTVSAATIATHMKHISERLGVHGRTSAVATGLRQGLID